MKEGGAKKKKSIQWKDLNLEIDRRGEGEKGVILRDNRNRVEWINTNQRVGEGIRGKGKKGELTTMPIDVRRTKAENGQGLFRISFEEKLGKRGREKSAHRFKGGRINPMDGRSWSG